MLKFCAPAELNEFANDPIVFRRVARLGQESLDLTPLNNEAVGLKCDAGGFLFHRLAPFLYETHTLFRPGKNVLAMALEALELMFCTTDCNEVITRIPVTNKAAENLAKNAGMQFLFTTRSTFHALDGVCDTRHYRITLWDWIINNQKLRDLGHEFHSRLDQFPGALQHGDDEAHDCFVGFGYHCLELGSVAKGVIEYNKWALFTGYKTVSMNENGEICFDNVVIRRDGEITCL